MPNTSVHNLPRSIVFGPPHCRWCRSECGVLSASDSHMAACSAAPEHVRDAAAGRLQGRSEATRG